jgi:hypothetical protein
VANLCRVLLPATSGVWAKTVLEETSIVAAINPSRNLLTVFIATSKDFIQVLFCLAVGAQVPFLNGAQI